MKTSIGSLPVRLRPFGPSEEAFVYTVYVSSRAFEMALVPWPDEQKEAFLKSQFIAQQRDYGTRYPGAVHSVIYLEDVPVGRLYVAEGIDNIKILDVTLLPQHQRQGIGSQLFKNLKALSEITAKPLLIHVETYSPSIRFFEQAGFTKLEEQGVSFLMQWSPTEDHKQ